MWVLLASIEKRIEGTHTYFLQMIMEKRAKKFGDGSWETPVAEGIRKAAVTHSDRIYTEQRQATIAQWVELRPLFEVCARKKGYEGGGRRRKVSWSQEATRKKLRATLEDTQESKRRKRIGGEMDM